MNNTYQHTHDFAKHLQEIVDDGEFAQCLDNLLDHDNFPLIHEMPHQSRYRLIRDIAASVPEGQEHLYREADEAITFLLMSVPYEPLCPREQETAQSIAKHLKAAGDGLQTHDFEIRHKICAWVAEIYTRQNGLSNQVGIGRFSLSGKETDKQLNYYNGATALYYEGSVGEFKEQYGFEVDLHDRSFYNVLIRQEDFETGDMLDVTESILHEIRHHQQVERPGVEIAAQREVGINSLIRGRSWPTAYYAQMEERQTYGYTGWIKSNVTGGRVTSEIEATNNNLMSAGLSVKTTEAMLLYNYDYNRRDRGARPLSRLTRKL